MVEVSDFKPPRIMEGNTVTVATFQSRLTSSHFNTSRYPNRKTKLKSNSNYSVLFYSILFYSILFYSILFYSILFHCTHVLLFSENSENGGV